MKIIRILSLLLMLVFGSAASAQTTFRWANFFEVKTGFLNFKDEDYHTGELNAAVGFSINNQVSLQFVTSGIMLDNTKTDSYKRRAAMGGNIGFFIQRNLEVNFGMGSTLSKKSSLNLVYYDANVKWTPFRSRNWLYIGAGTKFYNTFSCGIDNAWMITGALGCRF